MKKFLYIICLEVVVLLAAACSKDEAFTADETQTCSVTFSASLDLDMQGRALGNRTAVNQLVYAVYEGSNLVTDNAKSPQTITPGASASVSLKLIKGRTYKVAFWAQSDKSPYTLDCEKATVAYRESLSLQANQDTYDAFWKVVEVKADANGMQAVKLVRPFAQLNFGTDDFDKSAFKGLLDVKSSLTVTSPSGMHLLSGEALAPASALTFSESTIPADLFQVGVDSYRYLAMNYLFAGAEVGKSISGKLTITAGATKSEASFTALPLQRNYRTNVYGSLLTGGGFDWEITSSSQEQLGLVASMGGNVKLTGGSIFSQSLNITAGKPVVIDLNNQTVTGNGSVWNESQNSWSLFSVQKEGAVLTLKNGTVQSKENDSYAVDVRNGGKVIIESGTYVGNISCIYCHDGTVEIKGGTFSILQTQGGTNPYGLLINCLDANYKNGTAKIIITGGKFENFNPVDCDAEGAHTNFVAEGYATQKVSETPKPYGTYEVVKK